MRYSNMSDAVHKAGIWTNKHISTWFFRYAGFCMDQSIRVMYTSLDDNSRGLQVVHGVDKMDKMLLMHL